MRMEVDEARCDDMSLHIQRFFPGKRLFGDRGDLALTNTNMTNRVQICRRVHQTAMIKHEVVFFRETVAGKKQ